MKTFIHKFSNGTEIRLDFDLSKPMPYCRSNLRMDLQPKEILSEYRQWQETVILPELMNSLNPQQLVNMVKFGIQKMKE